jgi:predicted DNA-binding protein (UPF0251 family)
MPRPCVERTISGDPKSLYFKPRGIPGRDLEEVVLTLDEWEAIRLADREGLYQEDAAARMNVSRQTFGNIVASAHKKIAEALVDNKALRIEGCESGRDCEHCEKTCKRGHDGDCGGGRRKRWNRLQVKET